jgi:hypothetical protein
LYYFEFEFVPASQPSSSDTCVNCGVAEAAGGVAVPRSEADAVLSVQGRGVLQEGLQEATLEGGRPPGRVQMALLFPKNGAYAARGVCVSS